MLHIVNVRKGKNSVYKKEIHSLRDVLLFPLLFDL